jgi:hypothetical protein
MRAVEEILSSTLREAFFKSNQWHTPEFAAITKQELKLCVLSPNRFLPQ